MSNGEQAAALRLLMAARELLTDTLASDVERKRLAEQIGRFIGHEPVDAAADPLCGRCGKKRSEHPPIPGWWDCPKGGGVFTHAPTVKR